MLLYYVLHMRISTFVKAIVTYAIKQTMLMQKFSHSNARSILAYKLRALL